MKVLVTGVNGQVGWELARRVPAGVTLDATDRAVLDLATADVAALEAIAASDEADVEAFRRLIGTAPAEVTP